MSAEDLFEDGKQVETRIEGDRLVVSIPKSYLKRAFYLGLTTTCCASVTDDKAMLNHLENVFHDGSDDSLFGRFIDSVCAEAIESGCEFLAELEEDE